MKTLDEVIKALEYCLNPVDNFGNCNAECPYIHCCDPSNHDVTEDALHYLKEYRSDKAMWDADRKGLLDWIEQYKEAREKHQQAVIELKHKEKEVNDILTDYVALKQYWAEQQANPALTWDELRTMEGKPVWVRGSHGPALSYKGWALISFNRQGNDMKCQLYNSAEFWIGEEDYGTDWQAYRKER